MERSIKNFMTETPMTIGEDTSLEKAKAMMLDNDYHHLPVLSGGELTGIISHRDISFTEAMTQDRPDFCVGDVMTLDPYIVQPTEDITNVVKTMLKKNITSAIVAATNSTPWGIFTMTDALQLLVKFFDSESVTEKVASL